MAVADSRATLRAWIAARSSSARCDHGIDTLPKDERAALIADPEALARLHSAISRRDAHPSWHQAREDSSAQSDRAVPLRHAFGTELSRSPIRATGD